MSQQSQGSISHLEQSPYQLVSLEGEKRGKVFSLFNGANLVGRWDPDDAAFPEIDLEREDTECKISRRHALIDVSGDGVCIEDLSSLNGTFVNDERRLSPGVNRLLKVGDKIRIGQVVLLLEKAPAQND